MNNRKVELVPYDKKWPYFYEKESQNIKNILGNHLKEIYHIGSTAISNMPAKPVIDIILECDNLDDIDLITKQLNKLNYNPIRRQVIPHRSFFTRRQDKDISYHLHILERGDPQVRRHVNFKDYLINHPDDAKVYASLKIKLAKQFADDIYSYVFNKSKLVQEIDKKAKLWQGRKQEFQPPNLGREASAWSQEKIIKAMEANLNVFMTHFAQYINEITLIRIPGYTVVHSGLMDDTFNYVLDADFSSNDASKKILEAIHYFSANKIPFLWWVSPYDKPYNLAGQLQQEGLIPARNNVGMYIDLAHWQPSIKQSKLEIIKVTDKKGLYDFANVLVNNQTAYNQYYKWVSEVYTADDPIEFYVGYINNKPVIRGQLVYFAQAAGIHGVSTAIDEGRQEYGTAIQHFLLQRAKSQGFHIAVLQASEEDLPLYLKQGFKECCVFKAFKPLASRAG